MKVTSESVGAPDICVYLDGVLMGCVQEADDEEGYVLKKLPPVRDEHGGFPRDGVGLTRMTGKVEIKLKLGGMEVPYSHVARTSWLYARSQGRRG